MSDLYRQSEKRPEIGKKGWLFKWTNVMKGYQKRWFVLSNGVLSYYRKQNVLANETCRRAISLDEALIQTTDPCCFVISNCGKKSIYLKAANEAEQQSWVTTLELAKAKAIRVMEYKEEEKVVSSHVVSSQEINTGMQDLTERLENLRTCYDILTKHDVALQNSLSDLNFTDEKALPLLIKIVNDRSMLFRTALNAMTNASSDYLRKAEIQEHKWSKILQHEREQKQRLEEIVEKLTKQLLQIEEAA